jgi:hypothetical protein
VGTTAARRRLVTGLLLVACVGLAQTVSVTVAPENADWWAAQRGRSLPATYDEVALLPVVYQKAVMQRLPADAKSKIWASHLDRVIDEEGPSLTPSQLSFLRLGGHLKSGH